MICQCLNAGYCPIRGEVTPHLHKLCTLGRLPTAEPDPLACIYRGEQVGEVDCGCASPEPVFVCGSPDIEGGRCTRRKPTKRKAGVERLPNCLGCKNRSDKTPPCPPVRDVHIGGLEPDTRQLNCSVVDWQDERLLFWRKGWLRPEIWVSRLDENHQAISNQKVEIPNTGENRNGSEDPRAFVFGGKLHVEYVAYDGRTASIWVAELSDGFKVARTWKPEHNQVPASTWQKNWGFFEHENNLHAVYSIQPHMTLRFGERTEAIESPVKIPWSHGMLRGGASPVLHEGVYYSFFHGSLDGPEGPSPERVYSIGCYTFEAKPPFNPIAATPRPILLPDKSHKPRPETPHVVFPCGAVFDSGRWVVSYGYYDATCRMAEFDHEQLQRAMVRL